MIVRPQDSDVIDSCLSVGWIRAIIESLHSKKGWVQKHAQASWLNDQAAAAPGLTNMLRQVFLNSNL
jgi:hypothetical protein